jgi:outer membrane immunogenic protein
MLPQCFGCGGMQYMGSKSARRGAYAAQLALLSLPVSALVAGAPALAQPATFNWTGMYVGFYAGGVWGRGKSSANTNCPEDDNPPNTGGYYCDTGAPASFANADAVTSASSRSVTSGKFTGGIQAGHNWQAGSFVYGVEGDFGAFRLRGARSTSGIYPADTSRGVAAGDAFVVSNSFDTNWLFTARGRVGWAASNWLLFATGGLAMSRVTVTNSYSDINTSATASESKVKVGWTLGGGMEVALTRNWSLKGEYLYVDLGSVSTLSNIVNPGNVGYANALRVATELTAHMARLGANFRF